MKILVTGDTGLIGRDVSAALQARGDNVVGFDKSKSEDLLDHKSLEEAAEGCDAIVHCAAIKNDSRGTPAEIFATNVTGTWNALQAAERIGAGAFVYLSTAQVFGVYDPTPPALDVPITDDHPRRATRPYGLSKCFGEDLCASFSARTGIPTVALRPVAVFDPPTYEWAWRERVDFAARSWQDRAFVDVRDVSAAVLLAIDSPPIATHVRLTLCSPHLIPGADPSSARRGFDTSAAASVLGWRPRHTWDEFVLAKTDNSTDSPP
jgi:nucleoside-diphosphate-sugar epimerase